MSDNIGIADALAALTEQNIQMIYTTVHQVLAQGNYVLAVSEGTFGGVPASYYDLWRVEKDKIAEHWDVMETIVDKNKTQSESDKRIFCLSLSDKVTENCNEPKMDTVLEAVD